MGSCFNASEHTVMRTAMNFLLCGKLPMERGEPANTLCKSTGRTVFGNWSIVDVMAMASEDNAGNIAVMTPHSSFTMLVTRMEIYLPGRS